MTDDAKKISRKLAGKYAGITDVVQPPAPAPAPPPAPSRGGSVWDDYDAARRSGTQPKYQRDRWAAKPSTPASTRHWSDIDDPFAWRGDSKPARPAGRSQHDRPAYTHGDVDWKLAKTAVLDRSMTWGDFVYMLGLEFPLYPGLDHEIYEPLNEIFLTRKGALYRK